MMDIKCLKHCCKNIFKTCLYFFQDWRYNVLGKVNNPAIELVTKAEKTLEFYNRESEIWVTCDVLIVVSYLFPKSITKVSEHNATVELQGLHTRGQLVLDHLKKNATNVTIVESVDEEAVMSALWNAANNV